MDCYIEVSVVGFQVFELFRFCAVVVIRPPLFLTLAFVPASIDFLACMLVCRLSVPFHDLRIMGLFGIVV